MNDFFVGYAARLPKTIASRIRIAIATMVLVSAGFAIALVGDQSGFEASTFEFTQVREFQGTLRERPYPSLLVRRPGATSNNDAYSRYLIVGTGKYGPATEIRSRDGLRVSFKGKLIYRAHETAIELQPATLRELAPNRDTSADAEDLGQASLAGEIVDTKCFLGVMNPGEGKVHKDCAALCIHGGITPALATRDAAGRLKLYFLVDESGDALNPANIALQVGAPVKIEGALMAFGSETVLRATRISVIQNR